MLEEKLKLARDCLLELAYLLEVDDESINDRFSNYEQFYQLIIEKAKHVKFQSDEFDSEKA